MKHTYEEVKNKCFKFGFQILDVEYRGSNLKHNFMCMKHKASHPCSPSQIFAGKGMACCKIENWTKSHSLDFEKIKADLFERGFEVLSKRYLGIKHKHSVKCIKHKKSFSVKLENMVYRKDKLICCKAERVSGSNSRWYDPSLTDADRQKHRGKAVRVWRKSIYKRDDYTCQKCMIRGGELNAHHICNWKDHEKVRFEIGNGITLCIDCHKKFHNIYGNRKTNQKQMDEFKAS